jgi:hypothetical protein
MHVPKRHLANISCPIEFLNDCSGIKSSHEEEEGFENCKEEDEERKEGEGFDESISRVIIGKDPHLFDVSSCDDQVNPDEIDPMITP